MARLGLGLAALGRPGYMTLGHALDVRDSRLEAMRANAWAVLDAAYAGGLRHVDAARSYGQAEAFLRAWLDARGHRDVTVSSKWGYRYTANWQPTADVHEVKDLSLEHLDAQWQQTQAALGPHLSVYQIHSVTLESGVLDDRRVIARLEQLRDQGVAMGLSVTGPRQADVIRAALRHPVFTWVQATCNLLERSAEPALAEAHARGVHVIVKEGLANGRLSPRGDPAVNRQAQQWSTSADALSLGWLLAQSWADVVLSGAATVDQLTSNLQATHLAQRTPPWAELDGLRERPDTYWQRRAQLEWS